MRSMTRVMGVWSVAAVVCWLGAGEASANLQYFQAYKKAYPTAKASCTVCHLGAVGSKANLNSFGTSLAEAKGTDGALLAPDAALKSVESKDADGDGASNAEEIAAGTGPGDAKSTPSATPAPTSPAPPK